MKFLEKVIGDADYFYDETTFYSDNEIAVRINNLQSDYRAIAKEIDFITKHSNMDIDEKQRVSYLINQRREIQEMIAFWASNNCKNIDDCISMFENNKSKFLICALAIKDFYSGDKKEAFLKINSFLKDGGDFYRHYLVNKIYGMLLCDMKKYKEAKKYVVRAIKLRPEDIELHKLMSNIHRQEGNITFMEREDNIITILEIR